jgi:hypothetical protein
MIVRGLAVVALASSLGACSTVGSMWGKLRGNDSNAQSLAAPASVTETTPTANTALACDTLRRNASPEVTTDAATRQMAIDEMKRAGCADIPAS